MSTQSTDLMLSASVDLSCGISDDCEITLLCNNKHFIILLSSCSCDDKPDSIECTFLKRLDVALKSNDEPEIDKINEEISDIAALLFQPFYKEFASDKSQVLYLDSYINPETYKFQLVTVNGKPEVIRCSNDCGIKYSEFSGLPLGKTAADLNLPRFPSKQVIVLEKYMGSRIVKVSAGGQVMCCKVADRWTQHAIDREFHCLEKISAAGLDPPLRIPKLCGLIESAADDHFGGILITDITPNPETPNLGQIDVNNVPISRRIKWARQIEDAIQKLHDIGVVWGDAKADNVLIDRNDNTWIIDFGGGWTDNWVQVELANSVKGDLQGLKAILHFLGV